MNATSLPKILPGTHLCAVFNRKKTKGKAVKHARRCGVCKAHMVNAAKMGLLK